MAGLLEIAIEGVHGEIWLQGGKSIPSLEETGKQHGDQLVGAVASHHVLHWDAVIGGKGAAQLLGSGIGIAVKGHLGKLPGQLLQDGSRQRQERLVGVQVDAVAPLHRVVGTQIFDLIV